MVENILDTANTGVFSSTGKNDSPLTIMGLMDGSTYTLTDAFVTGLTINVPDPNSLITVDVSIVASKNELNKSGTTTMQAAATEFPTYVVANKSILNKFKY